MKFCIRCEKWRVYNEFYNNKRTKDGKYAYCKDCSKFKVREWTKKNPERIRELNSKSGKKYYYNHLEERRASSRKYNSENRKKRQVQSRQYYLKNRERICAKNRLRLRSPIFAANRRARKIALPDTFTKQEWQHCLNYFNHSCVYCGNYFDRLHMDHYIPLSKDTYLGTVKENIVPACPSCNISKQDALPQDWLYQKYSVQEAYLILRRIEDYFKSL